MSLGWPTKRGSNRKWAPSSQAPRMMSAGRRAWTMCMVGPRSILVVEQQRLQPRMHLDKAITVGDRQDVARPRQEDGNRIQDASGARGQHNDDVGEGDGFDHVVCYEH